MLTHVLEDGGRFRPLVSESDAHALRYRGQERAPASSRIKYRVPRPVGSFFFEKIE
jgi:hypothetical protein